MLAGCPSWADDARDKTDIANRLAKEGIYDSALLFYNKALQVNPGYAPALAGRAQALRRMKHPVAKKPPKPKRKKERRKQETAKTNKPEADPAAAMVNSVVSAVQSTAQQVLTPPEPAKKKAERRQAKPPVEVESQSDTAAPALAVDPAVSEKPSNPQPTASKPKIVVPEIASNMQLAEPELAQPELASPLVASAVAPRTEQAAVSQPSDKSNKPEEGLSVPTWLIALAIATFATLVVTAVWCLSPTLTKSKQQHSRLKQQKERK